MSERTLPDDVYAETCSRVPLPNRDDLPAEAKELFDYFSDPNSASYVGLRGPGSIRLYSPELLLRVNPASRYIRYESGIPEDVRELAILVTGRAFDSQFEWTAHEPAARKAGVPDDVIDVVKYRKPVEGAGLAEAHEVIITLGRQMWEERKVPPESYARAVKLFGPKMLVDISWLMGNYAWTAALISIFDVQVHPEKEPLLPED
jgi:4-carboxymuconolactone decarboxylase